MRTYQNTFSQKLKDILQFEPSALKKTIRVTRLIVTTTVPAPIRRQLLTPLKKIAGASLAQYLFVPGLKNFHKKLSSSKKTVLVVCHDGSRTGAPILGYNIIMELLKHYNVIALFLESGPLLNASQSLGAIVIGPTFMQNAAASNALISAIVKKTTLRFAIVNSIAAKSPLKALARRHIPSVSLFHEFASYTLPKGAFSEAIFWSNAAVFSTQLTLHNALEMHFELRELTFPVIPQGRCLLPKSTNSSTTASHNLSHLIRPKNFPSEGLVILGLGAVEFRKGVDLFIDCAARILRNAPTLPVRFIWVGKDYDSNNEIYLTFLTDQIQRAELSQHIYFVNEVEDLQKVYQATDILLLTSRLDPLPNVAIDALSEGIPVLCFDQCSGIANILKEYGLAENCVAPFLDTAKMTEQIIALANSASLRQTLSAQVKQLAAEKFQMSRYIEKIAHLAELQCMRAHQERLDVATIIHAKVLRLDYALHFSLYINDVNEAAFYYTRSWATNLWRRKPFPGFHPGIYQEQHALQHIDPLADYLRKGCPTGPWIFPLITPQTPILPIKSDQRTAVHIHVFYLDLITPIIEGLQKNQTSMDLLISVVNEKDQQTLTALFQQIQWKGKVEILLVPNKGRDIGTFLTAFSDTLLQHYDFVGHFHTKASPDVDKAESQRWVHFLLSHLLGENTRMADRILGVMSGDKNLGLVFPDDPNVLSWGKNRPYADALAQRLGIPTPPKEIVFPVGSMFWARVSALKPLFNLGLSWDEYPDEPVPYDGTMLHTLERILPLVVTSTGQTIALSHVPGVTR